MDDRKKLFQIGVDFREGRREEKTWETLNNSQGKPFASGESYRCFVKKELKKLGKLKSKEENLSEKENMTSANLEQNKRELEDIKKEYNKINKEIDKLESKEERRLKVIEKDDYYTIYSNKREITVSKEKVKLIKQLYCDENGLEINELCRKVNVSRRDFMLIKYAFNIVHNDIPFLDEELDGDINNLVEDTIERKKEKYFLKLQEKEIEVMKNEINTYRQKDYLFNKIVDKIKSIVINPVKYTIEIKQTNKNREALLDLEDLHLGLSISNYWNTFNSDVARERFKTLTKETILKCAELGARRIHVSDLGDNIAGIIHETIEKESELTVDEQVKFAVELIGKMLIEFSLSNVFDEVVYTDTVGNHGRIFKNKDEGTEKENFEYFISWGLKLMLQNYKNIIFEENIIDEGIIIKNICGVKIFMVHGHLDNFNKIASDLTMMIGKAMEIHLGHLHHNKSEDFKDVEVFMGRSFSGADSYSKNKRLVGKAGQRLYIYSNGKRDYISDIELN